MAISVPRARSGVPLLGPGFVAAIAYVDPGNVATSTAAGARYGSTLLWVVIATTGMAGLVQYLAAKLGLVTGKSLTEVMRDRLSTRARLAYWAQAEVVAITTGLAEVLGGAIALNLLFGLPVMVGGLITGVVSTVLLILRDQAGQRIFEHVVIALLVIIGVGFVAGLVAAPPTDADILSGVTPGFAGADSLWLVVGMFGATVMPHAVYLHSSLAKDRGPRTSPDGLARMLRTTRADVTIAMTIAGAVNIALLLLAAGALSGSSDLDSLGGTHDAIAGRLGDDFALLFAIGLLASGLAATAVGTHAGAEVMASLLVRTVPMAARRLITLVPAIALLSLAGDPTRTLVGSQVVLAFGLPFALIPLILLTSRRDVMGARVNHRATTAAAWGVAAVALGLDAVLLWTTLS
ncbi:Manganese transport protein MntH [Alloactinosynnema sp. L-07]|uniref:Nramp family divalent metal transporter n=1 Tax=Alloactinosynnema sp. L-07 TaxID=1653480 RepID=UPI00065F0726|nr:Nramp family divalent metal transporter [Alloactinosynnema sp. L-07]CRK61305.1 Manganese transport protein MntH [Alloactinosynnema sp. L-07]